MNQRKREQGPCANAQPRKKQQGTLKERVSAYRKNAFLLSVSHRFLTGINTRSDRKENDDPRPAVEVYRGSKREEKVLKGAE